MSVAISGLLGTLRREVDPQDSYEERFTSDGVGYTYFVQYKPIVSATTSVFINHAVYTSGVDQVVPSGVTGTAGYHYQVNLNRGQFLLLSGTTIFQLWNGTTVTTLYDATKYTDTVLAGYLTDGIPKVESQLNLGLYYVDATPSGVGVEDSMGYYGIGVAPTEIGYVPESLKLVDTLITLEASISVLKREKRVGTRNNQGAVIRDGDIEVNMGNVFRSSESAIKDLNDELKQMYADIKLNMDAGIGIKQLNEKFIVGQPWIDYDNPDWIRGGA